MYRMYEILAFQSPNKCLEFLLMRDVFTENETTFQICIYFVASNTNQARNAVCSIQKFISNNLMQQRISRIVSVAVARYVQPNLNNWLREASWIEWLLCMSDVIWKKATKKKQCQKVSLVWMAENISKSKHLIRRNCKNKIVFFFNSKKIVLKFKFRKLCRAIFIVTFNCSNLLFSIQIVFEICFLVNHVINLNNTRVFLFLAIQFT